MRQWRSFHSAFWWRLECLRISNAPKSLYHVVLWQRLFLLTFMLQRNLVDQIDSQRLIRKSNRILSSEYDTVETLCFDSRTLKSPYQGILTSSFRHVWFWGPFTPIPPSNISILSTSNRLTFGWDKMRLISCILTRSHIYAAKSGWRRYRGGFDISPWF